MNKHLFLFIFSLLAAGPLYPQPPVPKGSGVLSGQILDKVSMMPVEYANTVLYSIPDSSMINGSVADSAGKFVIRNIPKGDYYLAVSFIGYQKQKITGIRISAEKKEVSIGPVYLDKAENSLKEVEITADRNPVEFRIDKKVVNASQQLNAQGGTAVDLLRNVPSVNVDAEGNVAIRGSGNFKLLIDGRPAPVQGSEGLSQIPASSVENIEIITNPSAKYDPEGTAGIINVIMKKEKKKGTSGNINASAGLNNKYTGDILLNFGIKKVNFFAGAEVINRVFQPYSLYHRETYYSDTTRFNTYETFRTYHPRNYTARAGIDYTINQNNSVSLSADYNAFNTSRDFTFHLEEWYDPAVSTNYYLSADNLSATGHYMNSNLSYTHSFAQKGHEISSFLTYSKVISDFDETLERFNSSPDYEQGSLVSQNESFTNGNRNYLQFKVDYTKPFTGDYKLEAGFQTDQVFKNNSYDWNNLDTATSVMIPDTLLSNRIGFRQEIEAVYATFSGSLWEIGYQLGVRAEYYSRNLEQKTDGTEYPMSMYNIFPSVHFNRSLPADQEIQLGYSRRVNRPDDRQLNPFPYFMDDYTIQSGNPNLKPEFIDSYEMNYQKKFKWGFISAQGYYRQTNQGIYNVMTLAPDKRLWIYPDNMSKDYTIGLELSANITLFKWWKLSPDMDFSNYAQKTTQEEVQMSSNNNLFAAQVNSTFLVTETTRIQLNGQYNSPMKIVEGDFKASGSVSFSAKQEFFKKKFSATLSINDIFSTSGYNFNNQKPSFRVYGGYQPESPTVILSLSYRFNEFKPRRKQHNSDLNLDSGI